ncbi:MAG TPA: hypothetical protein ENK34_13860 [Rhodobacteraceae bacterium]|nr:hypothetical protein [Paracoccaceae bacterium]
MANSRRSHEFTLAFPSSRGWILLTDRSTMARTNQQREKSGFLSIEQTLALADHGNTIFDPWSLLISREVQIGSGNIFYPNVVVQCGKSAALKIGDDNTFFPSAFLDAGEGAIFIGDGNLLGEGGVYIKAAQSGTTVQMGNGGRYFHGAIVSGQTYLGSGTQILGPVHVENCILAAGGTFEEENPDKRGAVAKGSGRVRNLTLKPGDVAVANGLAENCQVRRQLEFHPYKGPTE